MLGEVGQCPHRKGEAVGGKVVAEEVEAALDPADEKSVFRDSCGSSSTTCCVRIKCHDCLTPTLSACICEHLRFQFLTDAHTAPALVVHA